MSNIKQILKNHKTCNILGINLLSKKGIITFLGVLIIIGICTAIALTIRNNHHQKNLNEVAKIYNAVLNTNNNNKQQNTLIYSNVDQLIGKYPQYLHTMLASFIGANVAINEKKVDKAIGYLNFVINDWSKSNSNNQYFIVLAKIQLANIYAQTKSMDEALALLEQIKVKKVDDRQLYILIGLVNQTKGDIYVMYNQVDKARLAYKDAIDMNSKVQDEYGEENLFVNQVKSKLDLLAKFKLQ